MRPELCHGEETELVTVVIATCLGDRLEFLRLAVDSALGQRYSALELVVVVDGPVNRATALYLRALAVRDERVRCVWGATNRGPGAARNLGVAAARGRYVAFLDADDVASQDRLTKQVDHLCATGADLVGSWYRIVDEQGSFIEYRQMPVNAAAVRDSMPVLNPIANSTVLARREVLAECPCPEGRRFGEDYWCWVDLALGGRVLGNVAEYLVDYRRDAGFLARRSGWRFFRADLAVKMRALRLWPRRMIPFGIVAVVGVSSVRLMPRRVLGWAYWVRGRMRFLR